MNFNCFFDLEHLYVIKRSLDELVVSSLKELESNMYVCDSGTSEHSLNLGYIRKAVSSLSDIIGFISYVNYLIGQCSNDDIEEF